MINEFKKLDVTIIGAGMIVHDLILPAVYHLQRLGTVGRIVVCGTRPTSLADLKNDGDILEAFPGQDFTAYPDPNARQTAAPDGYREILHRSEPFQAVIIALPDELHYPVAMDAIRARQHVLCVKPLVHTYAQAEEISKAAREAGVFVGIEYHKRFDRRSLIARRRYRKGELGDFVMGEAKMIEPYYYRFSNFQNWFTTEATDPFVYVGCHYVDLVTFITGLKPVEVSVAGVKGVFPNGREGYMWANGRVRFENEALLTVTDGLGYPDKSAGGNEQCLSMFFEGEGACGALKHNDQFRGVEYGVLSPQGPGKKQFHYVNPDFFQYVPWEGPGYKPIGYGPDSVSASIIAMSRIEGAVAASGSDDEQQLRRSLCEEIDKKGLIATPVNSWMNELVHEAARASILSGGDTVFIEYEPQPGIRRKYGE